MKTQFAAASALLVMGASLITAPFAGAALGDAVVNTVTSDAPLGAVSYYDATGTMQILTNQAVPWSVSFTNKDPSPVTRNQNGTPNRLCRKGTSLTSFAPPHHFERLASGGTSWIFDARA
jgi:hypothetical protein